MNIVPNLLNIQTEDGAKFINLWYKILTIAVMERKKISKRYIEVEPLIELIDEYIEEYDTLEDGYHNPKWCAMQEARRSIEKQPAADVVEVIPCKDCKYIKEHHYEEIGEPTYIKYTCSNKYGLPDNYQVHEWDYCSRGEKRDG